MDSKEILHALQNGAMSSEDAEKELLRILGGAAPVVENSAEGISRPGFSGVLPDWQTEDPFEILSADPLATSVVDVAEIEPGIVQVRMQDRAHKNTFSIELIVGLMQAFQAIQGHPDYKVVILTGYDRY